MSKDIYIEKTSSKFLPEKEEVDDRRVQDIIKIFDNFYKKQPVDISSCYRRGTSYANNSNKKTSIDIIQNLTMLLNQQYKDVSESPDIINELFANIKSLLNVVSKLDNDVDKNCILVTILGYTLGCLDKYEK